MCSAHNVRPLTAVNGIDYFGVVPDTLSIQLGHRKVPRSKQPPALFFLCRGSYKPLLITLARWPDFQLGPPLTITSNYARRPAISKAT
jgi:hypothetical protein